MKSEVLGLAKDIVIIPLIACGLFIMAYVIIMFGVFSKKNKKKFNDLKNSVLE